MTSKSDRRNCLNNLVAMVLADGEVHRLEMPFLQRVADKLQIDVPDWDMLIRRVKEDGTLAYPVSDRSFGRKVLKSMVAVAKSDGQVADSEKRLLLAFAKSIDLNRSELRTVWAGSGADKPGDSSRVPVVTFLVIITDFENVDGLLKTLQESRVPVRKAKYKDALHGDAAEDITVVCLHGARDAETTVKRCNNLLYKNRKLHIVPILGRYQGNQVKYLHEIGIKRCIVEPVYATDIANIFKDAVGGGR